MPEIIVQRIIQIGITNLRENPDAFNDIFAQFLHEEMIADYGQPYIDSIRKWFDETKIPIVQSWSFNPDRLPCVSVRLANEVEDESKAAVGDYWGDDDTTETTVNTGVFTTFLDVGIHVDRDSDQAIWLYYIIADIFFKEKQLAERFGLQLQTWNASDYQKEIKYMPENVWTRWIRFKCTTQNFLSIERKTDHEVQTAVAFETTPVGDEDL